jgi:cell filamentation protein
VDRYGVGQDPYCYTNSPVLRNLLDLRTDRDLGDAERRLSTALAETIEFQLPPYNLSYLQYLHHSLFREIYTWAGEIRTVDISKGDTHFCITSRIIPEAERLFSSLADHLWFEGLSREHLIRELASLYGDLNVIHPFRDGNGRAQRLLFEHIIINVGFEIDWAPITQEEWIQANIRAVVCDYTGLEAVLEKAVGRLIGSL